MKGIEKKSHWKFDKYLTISLLFVFVYVNINAQIVNETIEKTVKIDKNTVIDVFNNHSIDYKTWDKNQLKVVVDVNIESQKKGDAEEFYSVIKESINDAVEKINTGKVNIQIPYKYTVHTYSPNSVKIKLKKNRKKYNLVVYNLAITVYAPKTNNVKLTSNFGSINVDDLEADAEIEIRSFEGNNKSFYMGNCKDLKLRAFSCRDIKIGKVENADIWLMSSSLLKIGSVKNNLTLTCKFSDFVGTSANNATVDLHSSTFEMENVQNLTLKNINFSKNIRVDNVANLVIDKFHSSKLKIKKVNNLDADILNFSTIDIDEISNCDVESSNSSKFYINKIKNVDIDQAKFSHFKINELTKSFICESQSGDIDISNVAADFQNIKINGTFVNIDVDFGGCSYLLDVNLKYPNLKVADEKFKAGVEELRMSSFFVGNDKNTKSKVSFDCNNCKIRLE